MALRGDRKYTDGTDISYFMNQTGEKGEVLVFVTGGSGAAMDDANAVVGTPTDTPSGDWVAGVLLNDVVNLDLTRQHINWQKDEVQLGGKVTVLRHGEITTNVVDTGTTDVPLIGEPAYVGIGAITVGGTAQGWVSATAVTDGSAREDSSYRVGTFKSVLDSDGYIKVEVNIL
jgi:hypothetical protein